MIQVRNGVFETNSSSTHSICISKNPVDADGCHIDFHFGEFGWDYDDVDTADYLYTAIYECYDDVEEPLNQLKDILDSHSITYTFEHPHVGYYAYDEAYEDHGYIDHGYETYPFVKAVLDDESMLMRFLFGDSHVYTGSDAIDDPLCKCFSADQTYYDWHGDGHNYEEYPNPNHDEENYDYFFKGN